VTASPSWIRDGPERCACPLEIGVEALSECAQADSSTHESSVEGNPTLLERIRGCSSISPADAEDVMSVVGEELTDILDDDREPTD
jgi:hypothetical protein